MNTFVEWTDRWNPLIYNRMEMKYRSYLSHEKGIKFDHSGEWKENLRPINAAMLCWEEETVPSCVCILLLDLCVIKDCFPFDWLNFGLCSIPLLFWSNLTETLWLRSSPQARYFDSTPVWLDLLLLSTVLTSCLGLPVKDPPLFCSCGSSINQKNYTVTGVLID